MIVHLIDGTYELFRHFYGQRRFNKGKDKPFGAVAGVLHTVLEMIETGATHLGVATDHVIESFRNDLWPGYKTGEGIEPALLAQFHPLEEALAAMGVAVWPMVELEADDALASAARLASEDERVEKVCIWANDKDLAQCVRGDRVVQVDRRAKEIRDAEGVRAEVRRAAGADSRLLALVGDAAGRLSRHPGDRRGPPRRGCSTGTARSRRSRRACSASSASRRCCSRSWRPCGRDAPLFRDVDELRWRGPTDAFAAWAERIGDTRLLKRVTSLSGRQAAHPLEG